MIKIEGIHSFVVQNEFETLLYLIFPLKKLNV